MDDLEPGSRPSPNGRHADVPLPRTERPDAPAYLRTYFERRERSGAGQPAADPDSSSTDGSGDAPADESNMPLYLRQFRVRRGAGEPGTPLAAPIADEEPPTWTEAWAATSRSREVVLPPDDRPPRSGDQAVVDVHLVRHGETQGYSVNAGLTPMGRWQAHRRGHDLSKSIRDGEPLEIVCAATPRATETAEQIRRGAEQGLTLWARAAPIDGPVPMDEFRNFTVWTPSGEMDVTSAFRQYHAVAERYERTALGDRPLWLVEIDRFVRVQRGGGDPIQFWMTTPLLSFEPPSMVVLRFWAGIQALVAAAPDGGRIVIATHSGPIRAFAAWALGHDAGEPYNLEDVRVKVRRSLTEAQVTYRNRSVEVHVPPAAEWPSWSGGRIDSVGVPASAPPAGTTA
jgi:broad specificity phosphatase PhoE